MGEIKTQLYKIPPEIKYFASNKVRTAGGETFAITEDHTLNDVLRWVLCQMDNDKDELKTLVDLLDKQES